MQINSKRIFAAALMFIFIGTIPSFAQLRSIPFETGPATEKQDDIQRLSSRLQRVFKQRTANREELSGRLEESFDDPTLVIRGEKIAVDLIARESVDELLKELSALDFQEIASMGRTISGRIHLDDLSKLAQLPSLQYARPIFKPVAQIGAVSSQGDTAMYSHIGRSSFNIDGANLKIGALSDSYNTLGGASASVLSGDLPGPGNPNGYNTAVTVVKEYSGSGSDEARAMLEIIHDVSPGAELFARTAFEGEADFAQGILSMDSIGCDIIVDDIVYLAEPFFQDGLIAQAVNQVVQSGKVYFTSAGNMGRKSYESAFTDSGLVYEGSPVHDFDPSSNVDYTQSITVPAGVTLSATLQWDDPFGSLPNSVGGADTDLDIFFFNARGNRIAYSNTSNIVTGDPYEIISYTNNSNRSKTIQVVIAHYAGPTPTFMKYLCWTNSVTIDEYDTESSTIIGHANSAGAITVGAAAFYNTPAFGSSSTQLNSFSSAGGTPIFFDSVGNPITTIYRQKPEVVGPDGTNTTFFGSDITQDGDNYPNFFGTSASAPHLAAGGVLLMEIGARGRSQILDAMTQTVEDMDDPATGNNDSGFDFGTGFGMARISQAIIYQSSLPVELLDFSIHPMGKSGGRLVWQTASEHNNKRFLLEQRLSDGSFQQLASIEGKGQAAEVNQYEHELYGLTPGTHYFRLLQEDFDGSRTDHGLVSLRISEENGNVWSHPSEGGHQLVIENQEAGQLTIRLFGSSGQLLRTIERQVSRGERFTAEIASSDWPGGTYFYHISMAGADGSQSFRHGKFVL
ncbi:MAG: hypothetical protein AAFV25_02405 [Bacteroidota bacterium]